MSTSYMKTWQCHQCGETALNHKSSCSIVPIFECLICNKQFKNKYLLKQHQQCHSKVYFDCKECSQKFKRKTHLLEHLKMHSDSSQSFQCNVCSSKLKRKKDLGAL